MENIDCVDSLDPTYGYHKETIPPHVLCGLPGQTPKRIAKEKVVGSSPIARSRNPHQWGFLFWWRHSSWKTRTNRFLQIS